jgi:hypothetical protein
MKLRWKKEPRETGLRSVGAGPYRSSWLHDGETKFACVSPDGGNWMQPLAGWYWVAGWDSDIPPKNTCAKPCATEAEAKAAAEAYVKAHMEAK